MLRTENLSRRFGSFSLDNINLDIAPGEYYVLLGRSGAGKSLLLEMLTGLTFPDRGRIFLDGTDITDLKMQKRNLGLVFQDYALFPHLTVMDNIAFPLKIRKMPQHMIKEKICNVSAAMNISHLLDRHPDLLSGGEKQRVALARTLVTSPSVLLLDEPLASVDASLRDNIRRMLRKLNREGQTIIHVTHDFDEAISLASRVGVIHNGRIIQEGTPASVFAHPVNRFVARYAGIKNFFRVVFVRLDNVWKGVTNKGNEIILNGYDFPGSGLLVLRSQDCVLSGNPVDGMNSIHGIIDDIVPSPSGYEIAVNAGDFIFVDISRKEMQEGSFREGKDIWVCFSPGAVQCLLEGEEVKY